MARNNAAEAEETRRIGEVEGEKLDPIGVVERKLTRPDGSTVLVAVPVYPPFRLADRQSARKLPVRRSAPSLKRKRTRSRRREERTLDE